jgi:hypothetical protein
MRNRTQRRAAEREALKALRNQQRQNPATTQPPAQAKLTPEQAARELLEQIAAHPEYLDDDYMDEKERLQQNYFDALDSNDLDRMREASRLMKEGPKRKPSTMNTSKTINTTNNSAQNATKHGCCSESILIMKGENPADFKALETTWFKAYNPKDDAETEMVGQVVESKWYERRCLRKLAEMETRLMEESGSPLDWTEEQQKALARFQRYATARTNAVIKAIKALEDYRKNRTNEVIKTEKHEIKKQQAKRKAEDEMTVEECIKEMEEIAALRDQAQKMEEEFRNL